MVRPIPAAEPPDGAAGKEADLDEILDEMGWGRFQCLHCALMAYVWFVGALQTLFMVFAKPGLRAELHIESSHTSALNSLFFVGMLVGAPVWGAASDRLGRRRAFNIVMVLYVACSFAEVVAPSYAAFAAARLVLGFLQAGQGLISFVLCVELFSASRSATVGFVVAVAFSAGIVTLSLVAAATDAASHWRLYAAVLFALELPVLLFLGWLVESPRWLLSRRGAEAAARVLRRVRQRLLLMVVQWCVVSFVYYGLSFNVGNLSESVHLNNALSGLVEVPGYGGSTLLADRYGRRPLLAGCLLGAGVACLVAALPLPTAAITFAAMMGKLAASGAFNVAYFYGAELFPTSVRTAAIGACSLAARVGGIVAPQALLLVPVAGTAAVMAIFGAASLASGLVALSLPETLHRPLPDTVADIDPPGDAPPGSRRWSGCCPTRHAQLLDRRAVASASSGVEVGVGGRAEGCGAHEGGAPQPPLDPGLEAEEDAMGVPTVYGVPISRSLGVERRGCNNNTKI
ncbi:hypothetical protein EMIHUDRAFT_194923 [Emiliania huxleyi CCMP1516]|uniref:Major facilitator superfamily (MFS) profile domain-containing protein n=2 Tax=Emiliania huxleyi TaxID=2903 RepID=A0A0D3L2C6_EMIH1|nr:hypothetical protein EMIHUDRAFT_194923 [Emiliania huxleyi CCMP1516]EOD42161.1 hypothetical protein EMIHUDRAFT_194923 [Emiliania huxleyi CCMP1516]|eukprot:XP_005794590.1 hypothetical protein EMIHUDRAFT_194923 [Emiliania huxleyi CCMP1516]